MFEAPLADIQVLCLAEYYPGPFAASILADWGAEVTLVSRPGIDATAGVFPAVTATLTRGVDKVVADLKEPKDLGRILQLAASADVVIEGFRPGVAERLGVGASDLQATNPSLIIVSISAFGQTGPDSKSGGHDLSVEGRVGLLEIFGDVTKQKHQIPWGDITAGLYAAISVLAQLHLPQLKRGAHIDVAMTEALASSLGPVLTGAWHPGSGLPDPPAGYGLYTSSDKRNLTLSVLHEQNLWIRLCNILDMPLTVVEASFEQRVAQKVELDEELQKVIGTWGYSALAKALSDQGIPWAPAHEINEILDDDQFLERALFGEQREAHKMLNIVRTPVIVNGTRAEATARRPDRIHTRMDRQQKKT